MRRLAILGLLCMSPTAWAAADFTYTRSAAAPEVRAAVAIDTRPLAQCRQASIKGALCLPAEDFITGSGQLPHERDLLWLLGTAGLTGSEKVLVTGTSAAARDFVAGLLYLAGQKTVRVLDGVTLIDAGPGRERGMVRSTVWTAPLRDHLWVLGKDILRDKPALADAYAPTPPVPHAVVVAADAATALARFTQWRAGQGFDVRVFPGPLPRKPDSDSTRR